MIPMKPYGLYSGDIEAMSSYMLRLAEAFSEKPYMFFSNFLDRYNAPELKCTRRPNSSGALFGCNGIGTWAERFSQSVSTASKNKIVGENLTQVPLKFVSDKNARGLLRPNLSWCRQCWINDKEEGKTPYVRLYWQFQLTKCCALHKTYLDSYCVKCGLIQPTIKKLPYQWACDYCGFDQTELVDEPPLAKYEDYWVSHSIFKLIERVNGKGFELREHSVRDSMTALLNHYNFDFKTFGEKLAVEPNTVERICKGGRPYFPFLADICFRIDVPIDQFLFDSNLMSSPELWRAFSKPRYVCTSHITEDRKSDIRSKMLKELVQTISPPLAPSHFAKNMNINYDVLRYHFPKEYSQMRQRFMKWESEKINDERHVRLLRVINGVLDLVKRGISPSEINLVRYGHTIPSDLRRKELRPIIRELLEYYQFYTYRS